MGLNNVQPVKIEPTQITVKKDGEVYQVGTIDMRIQRMPKVIEESGPVQGASRALVLRSTNSDGDPSHRGVVQPPSKRKRTFKRIGRFLLGLSGIIVPPWGVVLLIGWMVHRRRPHNKARRLFHNALSLASSNPNAALPLLEEAHRLNPGDNDILAVSGYVAHNAGDHTMAWRFLKELGRHVPLSYPELLILGGSYYRTEQYDEAIATLQQIPEDFEQYTKVALLLGGCFFAKGDEEAAIEALSKGPQQMVRMNEDLKELHYQLGLIHEQQGDEEQANQHFRRVYLADVNYRDVKERLSPASRMALPQASQKSVTELLRELAQLSEEGLLTEAEYSQKKADLLARL